MNITNTHQISHYIEWIALINNLNESEKQDLVFKESGELEKIYLLSLLQVEDEIMQID